MPKGSVLLCCLSVVGLSGCAGVFVKKAPPRYEYKKMDKTTRKAYEGVDKFLQTCIKDKAPVAIPKETRIDTIIVWKSSQTLDISLNSFFSFLPFREDNTASIYAAMHKKLGRRFRKFALTIKTLHQPIQELIPNFFRTDRDSYDWRRLPLSDQRPLPVARNISRPRQPVHGLYGRNIAIWPSHGWYYEQKLQRWEWQRARVFETVEDLLPMAFVTPYLAPMLENAGAEVFLPRERDVQTHEVIVDNDRGDSTAYFEKAAQPGQQWHVGDTVGFAVGTPPYTEGVNPFRLGSYRRTAVDTVASAVVNWVPDIPETGDYAVYIAYVSSDSAASDAHYTVRHAGGNTEFLINQSIGGGTWIYLGMFRFKAGRHPETGSVALDNVSRENNKIVTADAVRFGGGIGNISRNGSVSGRPRFVEGARYYLQYAGMPDSLVYNVTGQMNDYKDDYQGRGEWVNYLRGAPFGPNKKRDTPGLGIPIDLSLAFHTDAGFTRNDTTIGTLMIYCSEGADGKRRFPDGISRFASRDFGDILQTQLVEDIRRKYDPIWTRRSIWDRDYSEAFRPNVPAALLELLSHHNFLDMKFALDPRFRFDVSRSIYKAMLKFIATQYDFDYVVQPLPVTHFQAVFTQDDAVTLRWQPAIDPVEASAAPEKYIVYTRIEDNGFDNGVLVDGPQAIMRGLQPGVIYSYKVTAVNAGGESFPSEILSVCRMANGGEPVLIINGFDRVSAPATLETGDLLGFADFWDQGVPDRYDLSYIGRQFNFAAASPWQDDDAPGHGASYGNFETTVIPGNTFDFPYVHGKSLRAAGFSFVAASSAAVMDSLLDITHYRYVDLILGEQKQTDWPKPNGDKRFKAFPKKLQHQLSRFCANGGSLLISGAYVGTEMFENKPKDDPDIAFGLNTLHFKWRTNYAATTGGLFVTDSTFLPPGTVLAFNTTFSPRVYAAEAPDAVEPADSAGTTILRYAENNLSAAVGYHGSSNIVILGFPFETIRADDARDVVMRAVLRYLQRQ